MRRAAPLVLALGLAGCRADRGGEPALTARTPDRAFQVGSLDGPDAFGRVQSVLADDEGRVYVADGLGGVITVFDSTGAWTGSVGRMGAGPGEIGALQSLAWLGDTLAVMDPGNARIGLFDRSLTWAGQFPHQPIGGPAMEVRFHRTGRDAWLVQLTRPPEGRPRRQYVRFTSAGPADTVPNPLPPSPPGGGITCETSGGGIMYFEAPFGPREFFTFTPDGNVLRVWTATYRFAVTTPAGDTVRTFGREVAPVPVGDAEWEAASAGWRRFNDLDPGASCQGDYARPASKPAVRFAMYAPDGRLWVERYAQGGMVWDVWSGDSVVGAVAAPARDAEVEPYVRGDRMYVVTRDSLGVQRVVGLRITD